MSTHTCKAPGCKAMIPTSKLMCHMHWCRVPAALQNAVNDTWRKGNKAGYLAARAAAIRALASMIISLLCLPLFTGCMVSRLNRETCSLRLPIPPAGQDWGDAVPKWERVRFSVYSCLANDKVSKIKVDYSTKATYTGISIGTVDHEIDNEAVEAMTKGVTAAFLEALKHL
jgi:hypothetical protein